MSYSLKLLPVLLLAVVAGCQKEATSEHSGQTASKTSSVQQTKAPEKPANPAYDVVLESFPPNDKISVIKEVRRVTGMGLKEAKDCVEAAPKTIRANLPKAEAEKVKAQLEEAGAKVSIRPAEPKGKRQ